MRYSYPKLLLITLGGALVITLVVAASTSTAAFGVYNPSWDGTAEIVAAGEAAGTPTTVARDTAAYGEVPPDGSLAVVLSPTDSYGAEAGALRAFVRNGGTLLVAADYGTGGNELLSAVGATARVDRRPLRDEQRFGPSPAFPKTAPTGNHSYTSGVETLMLNHGSAVVPGTATPLVNASAYSYLDTDGNGDLDDTERLAQRPVVTVEPVGEGTVIVVSDPSVFLNSMLDRGDNAAFLGAIVRAHDRVLLDISHGASPPPLAILTLFLQDSPVASFVAGTLSILALVTVTTSRGIGARLRDIRGQTVDRPAVSSADIADRIRTRRPDWEDERIERVTESLIRRRKK